MKILSMYLPQFHKVKENDEWWGEGYTDWVSSRNAVSLYEGHYQPHIPLNQYYYNLMEKSAFEWQVSLMKKYGIDGQCIYHYWFKDGRQILEKPIEKLLEWKEVDMSFCLCWANQSWANSWSALKSANVWCDVREKKSKNKGDMGVLLEQEYGDEKEWKKHFEYLLDFFRDKRYIKIQDKPVFVIYQAGDIDVLEEMITCWNIWAREEGFGGIYFIGGNNRNDTLVDNVLYQAPQFVINEMMSKTDKKETKIFDYEIVWKKIIDKAYLEDNCMVGAFVGYDDTPRRGIRGCVIDGIAPEVFEKNLTKLMAINEIHNQPFTFINAWNEWGEGMHLEPDEKYGTSFLEAVWYAKEHYHKYLIGVSQIEEDYYEERKKQLKDIKMQLFRYESFWRIMDKWLSLKEKNQSISTILEEKNIHTVAIYGAGMLGKHLINELMHSCVEIKCVIDRNNIQEEFDTPILNISEQIPQVEAIIVTPSYDFKNIKMILENKGLSNIICIEELLK